MTTTDYCSFKLNDEVIKFFFLFSRTIKIKWVKYKQLLLYFTEFPAFLSATNVRVLN